MIELNRSVIQECMHMSALDVTDTHGSVLSLKITGGTKASLITNPLPILGCRPLQPAGSYFEGWVLLA